MIKIRLLFVRTCTLSTSWLHPLLPSLLLFQFVGVTSAGNCLIRGNEKIVDCANVTVNTAPAEDMKVQRSGYFSGNYGEVEIYSGVNARISGNTDDIRVRKGATLHQDGNSDDIYVDGIADMYGTANRVSVSKLGSVRIFGIVDSVTGPGSKIFKTGSIVNGNYIEQEKRIVELDKVNDEVNVAKNDLAASNGHINDISDIDVVLMKFIPDKADYWNGPSSKMVRAFGTITSVIAGKPVALGAHGSLTALSAATQGAASGLQS
jgi:hypothetical protein